MPYNNHITQQELKEILNYCPETGIFTWIIQPKNKKTNIAGSFLKYEKYIVVCINQVKYLAHRLAWLYMTGDWPKEMIDHINMIRNDNRWINLREATRAENYYNRTKNKNNTSGYKGVHWVKQKQKWQAISMVNRKLKHLGFFDNPKDASDAYNAYCVVMHKEYYLKSN